MSSKPALDTLVTEVERALAAARNPDGGWAYLRGKTSRVEPTAWVALGPSRLASGAAEWLAGAERLDGWYGDDRRAPVNYGFNGLVLLALLADDRRAPFAERLVRRLLDVRGLALPQSVAMRQDNSLQAWSWVDGTFSWVEPTAYCLLALKRAVKCGVLSASDAALRVDEAERLLVDRACIGGGWNYGNSNMLGKELRPHGPTTALALLALQDRPALPAVVRGLDFLTGHADKETSGLALSLAVIALTVCGRDAGQAPAAARHQAARSMALGNTVTLAALRVILADEVDAVRAFRV